MAFEVHTDRRLLSSAGARRYVRVQVSAPVRNATRARPPLCLGLVLDQSGSMAGEKLQLTQEAAVQALHALTRGDQFSIVAYNDMAHVLLPACAAEPNAIRSAEAALRALRAAGNTDLGAGWLTGCAQIAQAAQDDGALVRCLLLSDGLANRGITSVDRLVHHATELRARGVTTSTLGVGHDFDEGLMHRLAEAGGGHFYYAASPQQIRPLVDAEVGRVLDVVAREAQLYVRCEEGVMVSSLNQDPLRREGGRFCIELGSLRAGESRTLMLALDLPEGEEGTQLRASFELEDRDAALATHQLTLAWLRASAETSSRELPDREITRAAATLEVAGARVRALDAQRMGEYEQAERIIAQQLEQLRAVAGEDPVLLTLARELAAECEQYARPMYTPTGKRIHYQAYSVLKGGFAPLPSPALGPNGIVLRWLDVALAPAVEQARQALQPHGVASGLRVRVEPPPADLPLGPKLEVVEELRLVRQLAQPPELTLAFMSVAHFDNWFSHWHAPQRVVTVSLHDWRRMSSVPAAALIAYEILLHGLRALSLRYDPLEIMHGDVRGCLFDFCQQKDEVEIKLQAGHICSECLTRLSSLGFDTALVARAWSAVQQLAHAAPLPAHP